MSNRECGIALAVWRGVVAPLFVCAFFVLLASCSTGLDSFDSNPGGKTVPPVGWSSLTGLPPDKVQPFKDALALAAGRHDIGIVEGDFQTGTYGLTGSLNAFANGGTVSVAYRFELRDGAGTLINTIAGDVKAGSSSGGDAWSAVTQGVLKQISETVAQELAQSLRQKGYATRAADLTVPPAYLFAEAGPGAGYDIDLETLNGPDEYAAATVEPPTEGASAEPVPEPLPEPPPSKPKPGAVEIKAVTVVPVEGAKGPGNKELTAAMRRMLASVGWPVVNSKRADTLVIRGKVDMSKPKGSNQQVAVRWAVETPQGKPLGDVEQANSVPAGSLDGSWGEAATIVAEAAAGGIFDIIQRYR